MRNVLRSTTKNYLFCATIVLSTCSFRGAGQQPPSAKPEIKAAPPTPIAIQKEELGKPGWDPDWDRIIEEALPEELLTSKKIAKDVKPFCPRYQSMSDPDKRAYWAYFFQALAGAEAGLEPNISARHPQPEVSIIDPVTKRTARTEGLLQLAYMDSDRYGCDFDWEKDKGLPVRAPDKTIFQPKNNLLCGIKILDYQLITLKRPLLSGKSYWSTLQPGTVSYKVFHRQMANVPESCRDARPGWNEAQNEIRSETRNGARNSLGEGAQGSAPMQPRAAAFRGSQ